MPVERKAVSLKNEATRDAQFQPLPRHKQRVSGDKIPVLAAKEKFQHVQSID